VNSWQTLSLAFGLAAARTVPLVWLLPPLGGSRVPVPIRVALGGMVAALCLPMVLPDASALTAVAATASTASTASPPLWMGGLFVRLVRWETTALILVLAKEILVGTSIGICAGAAFRAAELAGNLSGASLGSAVHESGAPVGDLYLLLSVLAFLELGGLGMVAAAVTRSYQAIPVGDAPTPSQLRGLAELVVLTAARLWESALVLAVPIVVASWLATLAIAAMGRVAPELGSGALWLPVRPWLSLAILLLGVGIFEGDQFRTWLGGLWPLVNAAISLWRAPR